MNQTLQTQWRRFGRCGLSKCVHKKGMSVQVKKVKREEAPRNRRAVIPYFHEISHNSKACAIRFGVDPVLTSNFKLSKLTPFQNGHSGFIKTQEKTSKLKLGHVVNQIIIGGEVPNDWK
ncbi:MAG: hypothetical protein O7D30_11750 [Rickettsia endosymbiont of Ixodes persulcatus]|nr:hypothetical protein [Rickettsia endosymbiont of Ixodes persulcatus]